MPDPYFADLARERLLECIQTQLKLWRELRELERLLLVANGLNSLETVDGVADYIEALCVGVDSAYEIPARDLEELLDDLMEMAKETA